MGTAQFEVYADFVKEQLTAEETRKASLEQRGLAVITSCGVLASLGFGAVALAKRGDRVPFSTAGVVALIVGAVSLLIAAALALATNAPMRHGALNPTGLKASLREHADDDERTALVRVTSTRIGLFGAARRANDLKAILCLAALIAEVLGVALLGVTIAIVLAGSG